MSDMFTFIGGAAVGSLLTYMTKNKDSREAVENFIDGIADVFTNFLRQITPDTKDKNTRKETGAEKEKVKTTKTAKKTTGARRVTKKKKTVTSKKPLH